MLFGLYTQTLSPAWHPDDSGETITAAATLSTQHPPGYPLHTLLGRLAVVLGPGPAPFNVNLMAAFFGALSMVLLALLLLALGRELAPWAQDRPRLVLTALAGAALMGLTQTLWFQAGIAKGGIYTLNLALSLGLLLSALAIRDEALGGRPHPRAWALFGLLSGLGLAHHWTSILALAPVLAYFLIQAQRRLKAGLAPLLTAFCLQMLGLALYFILPLRQAQDSPLQWGDLSQLDDLLWLLSRGQYAGLEGGKSLGSFMALLGREAQQLLLNWTLPGLLALAAGWALLFRRRPQLAAGLLLLPAGLALAVAFKANPPADSYFIIDPYLIPLHLGAGLGLLGFVALPRTRPLLPAALLAAALGLGLWQHRASDHSDNYLGYDYGHNLLLSLPKDSIVLANGDANIATLLVPRLLWGKRPDLDILPTALLQQPWFLRWTVKRDPELRLPLEVMDPQSTIEAIAAANLPRLTVWTNMTDPAWSQPDHMVLRGLIHYRVGQVSTELLQMVKAQRIWGAFAMRGAFEPGAVAMDALSTRLVRQRYEESLARYGQALHALEDWRGAAAEYRRLGILRPGSADAWLDAGSICFKHDRNLAQAFWQRAAYEDPRSAQAWANLGVIALGQAKVEEARSYANKALALDPYLKMGQDILNAIANAPK